jgi:hypothetical protein
MLIFFVGYLFESIQIQIIFEFYKCIFIYIFGSEVEWSEAIERKK